jgi:hypothetical protein
MLHDLLALVENVLGRTGLHAALGFADSSKIFSSRPARAYGWRATIDLRLCTGPT